MFSIFTYITMHSNIYRAEWHNSYISLKEKVSISSKALKLLFLKMYKHEETISILKICQLENPFIGSEEGWGRLGQFDFPKFL